jgi:two-component system, OmpR family, response regulator
MEGYEVRVAHTGADALAQIADFDAELIILDLMLGGPLGGEDVLEHIRASGSDVPVLVVSALVGAGGVSFDGRANVQTMAKPFKVCELSRRMASMLRTGAGVGDSSRLRA